MQSVELSPHENNKMARAEPGFKSLSAGAGSGLLKRQVSQILLVWIHSDKEAEECSRLA